MMENENKKYFTLKEVADMLGFTYVTVGRMAREGRIPAYKISGQWRIPVEEFHTWFQQQKREAQK